MRIDLAQSVIQARHDTVVAEKEAAILDGGAVIIGGPELEEGIPIEEAPEVVLSTGVNLYLACSPGGFNLRLVPVDVLGVEVPESALAIVGTDADPAVAEFLTGIETLAVVLANAKGLT